MKNIARKKGAKNAALKGEHQRSDQFLVIDKPKLQIMIINDELPAGDLNAVV